MPSLKTRSFDRPLHSAPHYSIRQSSINATLCAKLSRYRACHATVATDPAEAFTGGVLTTLHHSTAKRQSALRVEDDADAIHPARSAHDTLLCPNRLDPPRTDDLARRTAASSRVVGNTNAAHWSPHVTPSLNRGLLAFPLRTGLVLFVEKGDSVNSGCEHLSLLQLHVQSDGHRCDIAMTSNSLGICRSRVDQALLKSPLDPCQVGRIDSS